MSDAEHMARFWDDRAREHAEYFVDNRLDYRTGAYASDDPEDFWAKGRGDLDRMLAEVGAPAIGRDDVVVDVGCGVGRLTRVLADRAAYVVGLDVSPEMVERARAHLADRPEQVKVVVGDGTSLHPQGTASVDVVVSLVVFQHLPDPEITYGYVREIGRVLRPGGWSAFQVSDDPGLHTAEHARPNALRRRWQRMRRTAPQGQDDPAWRGSAVDVDHLARVADEAGMDVAHVSGRGTQWCMVRLVRRP